MAKNKDIKRVDATKAIEILDGIYARALKGVPGVSKSVYELAEEYSARGDSLHQCVRHFIHIQTIKCGTSGFLTNLGGLVTLPVAIPANVSTVLYVQLRMVATVAMMAGLDPRTDEVQTLCYACLAGVSVSEALKKGGIAVGEKLAMKAIEKIPGEVFKQINKKVGFRFITKFGETGIVNLGKLVPGVSGIVGAGFDIAATEIIGRSAYRLFFAGKNTLPVEENVEKIDVVELDSIQDEDIDVIDLEPFEEGDNGRENDDSLGVQ